MSASLKTFQNVSKMRKFIDIGANITDDMYKGVYHGTKKHEADLDSVLKRCWDGGIDKMIITGTSLPECEQALQISMVDDRLFTTIGCHPTRCSEFVENPEEYLNKLKNLALKGGDKVVAIGECGLDYDRLHFCPKDVQKTYFNYQLQLCDVLNLPLFLHCRAASADFFEILKANQSKLKGGVVHSFDGTESDMNRAVGMGFYIGINGCSLKTAENLEVVSKIPPDRILLETDCPWCEIKPSHAGSKFIKTKFSTTKKFVEGSQIKGRNEPANIVQVLEVVAGVRNEDPDILCNTILENTEKLFFSNKIK